MGNTPVRNTVVSLYPSEYLTPMLCRNLRSSAESVSAWRLTGSLMSRLKHSRQQSEGASRYRRFCGTVGIASEQQVVR